MIPVSRLALALALAGAACGGSSSSRDGGPAGDGAGGGPDFSADVFAPWFGGPDYYADWSSGPPADPAFFPLAVWLQAPIPNGEAYAAIGVNTFVGLSWGGLTAENFTALDAQGLLAMNGQDPGWDGFTDQTALVGWAHQDEPDNAQELSGGGYGPCIYPDEIATRYAEMVANDPTRPVYLNLGRGVADETWVGRGDACAGHDEHYPAYAAAVDIVSFDVYPVNDGLPRELVAHGVDRLRAWAADAKPVWTWIETTRFNEANGRPTPADIRAEVWLALIHGAAGIGYFCHVFSPTFEEAGLLADDEIEAAVGAINARVTDVAQLLNRPSVENGVTVESGATPVDVMLKRAPGSTYLFAVARGGAATSATFHLRDFPATATAEVLDEGRQLPITDGELRDELDAWGVHLYRITY